MSDMVEMFKDTREHHKRMRAAFGVQCPKCREKQPKRSPSILLPQQRCKVDGYRDERPELTSEQHQSVEQPATKE